MSHMQNSRRYKEWMMNRYVTAPAEAAVRSPVRYSNSASFHLSGKLKSFLAIVQLLLNRYITNGTIANLDGNSQPPIRRDDADKFCSKILDGNVEMWIFVRRELPKDLFVEEKPHLIRKTL